jgi:hypothetical protein
MLLLTTNSVLCCWLSGVSDKQAGMSRCLCHPETVACCCISKAGKTGLRQDKMSRDRCLPPMVIANLGAGDDDEATCSVLFIGH